MGRRSYDTMKTYLFKGSLPYPILNSWLFLLVPALEMKVRCNIVTHFVRIRQQSFHLRQNCLIAQLIQFKGIGEAKAI